MIRHLTYVCLVDSLQSNTNGRTPALLQLYLQLPPSLRLLQRYRAAYVPSLSGSFPERLSVIFG